jgi:hypothetical protein
MPGPRSRTTDCNHDVEERHVLAVGQGLGTGGFADYPHLLTVGPGKIRDDHRDDGILYVPAKGLFDFTRDLRRGLAARLQVFHQGSGDLAVGPHRNRHGKFRTAPHDDAKRIAWSDQVRDTGPRAGVGYGRISRTATRDCQREGSECPESHDQSPNVVNEAELRTSHPHALDP